MTMVIITAMILVISVSNNHYKDNKNNDDYGGDRVTNGGRKAGL